MLPFNFIDDDELFSDSDDNRSSFGMINLCCWKEEIHKIEHYSKIIINNETINIHFPLFDDFYVKQFSCADGFTFEKLVTSIVQTGLAAGNYDTLYHPEHYNWEEGWTGDDFIGSYAITSGNGKSDIKINGNNVYIKVNG